MLAVTAAMLVASSCFVFLRITSRVAILRRLTYDDYFMMLAWVRLRPSIIQSMAD